MSFIGKSKPSFLIISGVIILITVFLFYFVIFNSAPSQTNLKTPPQPTISNTVDSASNSEESSVSTWKSYYKKLPTISSTDVENQISSSSSSSSVCPPFSSADGLWGLNNPYFNSMEFYTEHNETDFYEASTSRTDNIGSWHFGWRFGYEPAEYRRKRKRENVNDLHHHQHKKKNGGNNNNNNNNNSNTARIPSLDAVCREKASPELKAVARAFGPCEWTCPDGFTPFGAQDKEDYFLDHALAMYATPAMLERIFNTNKRTTTTKSDKNPRQHQLEWCYDFQPATTCLKNKVIVFFGDSHVRNIAQMLCRMLLRFFRDDDKWYKKGSCGQLDEHFDSKISVAHVGIANCTIAYLRTRYQLEPQVRKRFLHERQQHEFLQNPDFVVYGRFLWDLAFVDRPRTEVMAEFESDLNFLTSGIFTTSTSSKTKYIIKVPHYGHYKHRDGVESCSHWTRQVEERDAIICGLSRFLSNANTTMMRLGDKISIFDTFGSSRQVRPLEGTDSHGHHYEGTIAESMVQQFLSIICPPSSSDAHRLLKSEKYLNFMSSSFFEAADLSCKRMDVLLAKKNRNEFQVVQKCACGVESAVVSEEAKEHCAEMKRKGINAPWIIDE